jgi:hypothetical protein
MHGDGLRLTCLSSATLHRPLLHRKTRGSTADKPMLVPRVGPPRHAALVVSHKVQRFPARRIRHARPVVHR